MNQPPRDTAPPALRESAVRSYSRAFPTTFASGSGVHLTAADGTRYLDFLTGAGALNYGHNPAFAKQALIDYLAADGIGHGLDLATTAKQDFLTAFDELVLTPRGMDHKVMFCSPSGTNAIEAALKVARVATGRTNVVAFGGGFHGMTTGALAAMGSAYYRRGLEATLVGVTHVPYPVSPLGDFDSLDLLDRMVLDPSSGVQKPAAVLLETVQAEGGVYVAPPGFLRALREWCTRNEVLLVVDDIQMGCGRTGGFFSFEDEGIQPDLVTLSKSISAYGLPMALLLVRPEYDVMGPGQHNGTFRGNQLAFVAAAAALRTHWSDGPEGTLTKEVRRKGDLVAAYLAREVTEPFGVPARGRGLVWGLDLGRAGIAGDAVSRHCFAHGLVVESCGRADDVLKILPALTIGDEDLLRGLETVAGALRATTDGDRALLTDGQAA